MADEFEDWEGDDEIEESGKDDSGRDDDDYNVLDVDDE